MPKNVKYAKMLRTQDKGAAGVFHAGLTYPFDMENPKQAALFEDLTLDDKKRKAKHAKRKMAEEVSEKDVMAARAATEKRNAEAAKALEKAEAERLKSVAEAEAAASKPKADESETEGSEKA